MSNEETCLHDSNRQLPAKRWEIYAHDQLIRRATADQTPAVGPIRTTAFLLPGPHRSIGNIGPAKTGTEMQTGLESQAKTVTDERPAAAAEEPRIAAPQVAQPEVTVPQPAPVVALLAEHVTKRFHVGRKKRPVLAINGSRRTFAVAGDDDDRIAVAVIQCRLW